MPKKAQKKRLAKNNLKTKIISNSKKKQKTIKTLTKRLLNNKKQILYMQLLILIEKAVKLTLGFLISIFFILLFKLWVQKEQGYLFFVGDYGTIIIIFLITFGITFIIETLWKWEVREVLKPERRRPRWIRR
jgi:hypothetical protein